MEPKVVTGGVASGSLEPFPNIMFMQTEMDWSIVVLYVFLLFILILIVYQMICAIRFRTHRNSLDVVCRISELLTGSSLVICFSILLAELNVASKLLQHFNSEPTSQVLNIYIQAAIGGYLRVLFVPALGFVVCLSAHMIRLHSPNGANIQTDGKDDRR